MIRSCRQMAARGSGQRMVIATLIVNFQGLISLVNWQLHTCHSSQQTAHVLFCRIRYRLGNARNGRSQCAQRPSTLELTFICTCVRLCRLTMASHPAALTLFACLSPGDTPVTHTTLAPERPACAVLQSRKI
jgi:hypothetical protein